ncbi:hypothetical protein GYH30_030254 [Glycine max]|nr:hypothetical protein GYH30_030254 [Glycine max]
MDLNQIYTPMVVLAWSFIDLMHGGSDLLYRGVRFMFVSLLESVS